MSEEREARDAFEAWAFEQRRYRRGAVLEWITRKGNMVHAAMHGRFSAATNANCSSICNPNRSGRCNPKMAKKLTPEDVDEIRSELEKGIRCKDLAQKYRVSYQLIYRIKTGRTWFSAVTRPAEEKHG